MRMLFLLGRTSSYSLEARVLCTIEGGMKCRGKDITSMVAMKGDIQDLWDVNRKGIDRWGLMDLSFEFEL